MPDLSDKALAVFAFAAYHEMESGQPVTKVIRQDGKGHRADEEAVQELQARGLIEADERDLTFTPSGLKVLSGAIEGLRSGASSQASA